MVGGVNAAGETERLAVIETKMENMEKILVGINSSVKELTAALSGVTTQPICSENRRSCDQRFKDLQKDIDDTNRRIDRNEEEDDRKMTTTSGIVIGVLSGLLGAAIGVIGMLLR